MGKSRLQCKVAKGDEDGGLDYDLLYSLLSSEICPLHKIASLPQEVQTFHPKLEESLDALYEKRAATREVGLKGLIRALSQEVFSSYIANKFETLSHQILACMKEGSSAAAQALGLLVLTHGPSDATLQVKEEVGQCLMKVAKLAPSFTTKVAALDALAIVMFVCNVAQDTKDAMAFLWQIICYETHDNQKLKVQKPSDVVIVAALSGWTLLLSTLPFRTISKRLLVLSLPVLSSLLQSSNLAVRKAVGEAAAMLNETATMLNETTTMPYKASSKCTNAKNDHAKTLDGKIETNKQLSTLSKDVEDVTRIQVMQKVSHEMKNLLFGNSKKFQNRKERVVQRKSFCQLLTTLDDGLPREMKVKIPECKVLVINTWSHVVQLNALKHYLGDSGFQAHMQGNTLLREIFEVRLKKKGLRVCDLNLDRFEKRMWFSPNSIPSKARTKRLNRLRLLKDAEKAASFNVNGYESD